MSGKSEDKNYVTVISVDGTIRKKPFKTGEINRVASFLTAQECCLTADAIIVTSDSSSFFLPLDAHVSKGQVLRLRNRGPFYNAFSNFPFRFVSFFYDGEKSSHTANALNVRGIDCRALDSTVLENPEYLQHALTTGYSNNPLAAVFSDKEIVGGTDLIKILDKHPPYIPVVCGLGDIGEEAPFIKTPSIRHLHTDEELAQMVQEGKELPDYWNRKISYYVGDISKNIEYLMGFVYWAAMEYLLAEQQNKR